MIAGIRDAILRLSGGTPKDDWKLFERYVRDERSMILECLASVDPSDLVTIARYQGGIQRLDTILGLKAEAEALFAADKGTNTND